MSNLRFPKTTLILGFSTLAGIIYSSHLYLYHYIHHERLSWSEDLAESFSDWYSWALLCPIILKVAGRFPLNRDHVFRKIVFHIFASLVFSALQVALHAAVDHILVYWQLDIVAVKHAFWGFFARTYYFGLLMYWLIVFVRNAFDYYRNQEIHASRLESQLTQAQLKALKMQLHPHFLFNTLHAISSFVRPAPLIAERMIASLSDFLRMSIDSSNLQQVSLRQELEFLEKYLEIERIRFQDRLTVRMNIDPSVLEAVVPNLILQPLVENSIRHGISRTRGAGLLEIQAQKIDGRVQLIVRDNGKAHLPQDLQEGTGLSNTRARLEQIYGNEFVLQMKSIPEGGTEVQLAFPCSSRIDSAD